MMRGALVVCALAAVACGGATPYARGGAGVAPLATRPVEWNPTHADVGHVVAVADRGADVVVFADGAATVLESGAVSLVDRSVAHWLGAATIPAVDGGVPWIVGVDDAGRVRRLRARAGFEDVTARWGLERTHVLGASALGDRGAAFLVLPRDVDPRRPYVSPEREIALADGDLVTRFSGAPFTAIAAGGGVVAGIAEDGVASVDARRTTHFFPLSGARYVAVDGAGRVYAATSDAVYAENAQGELVLRYRATEGDIHGLVASKDRVWFAEGAELGALESAAKGDAPPVEASTGAKIAPDARLWPSTTGDVWVVARGALSRYARDEADPSGAWRRDVQPVFARACSGCHLPGGPAGVDLSTYDAWTKEKSDVQQRVLDQRDMPPSGHPLSDADREVIRAWISGGK